MNLRSTLAVATTIGILVLLFLPADTRAADALDGLADTCLETPLQDCIVMTAGYLNTTMDIQGLPMLAWQTQSGFTPDEGVLGGIVLFEYRRTGWTLLDADFSGYQYTVPQITDGESGILLHSAAHTGGSGSYNADLLLEYYDETWHRIDMHGWLAGIGPMLPAGLEIWKGVDYDIQDWFGAITAQTPLWRADDGNCCPSGGSATIGLVIENDALVAIHVDYVPPTKEK